MPDVTPASFSAAVSPPGSRLEARLRGPPAGPREAAPRGVADRGL